ncbi:MAG: phasin family protein [Deltaproteobacteria bacterium]|nr:phasin family protein [Deltaproteobacteria bacterium]
MKKQAVQTPDNNPIAVFVRSQIEQGQKVLEKVETEVTQVVNKILEVSGLDLEKGKNWVENLAEQFEASREEFEKQLSVRVTEVINKVGLATRSQIDDLAKRLESLAKRVETVTRDSARPAPRAKAAPKARRPVAQA